MSKILKATHEGELPIGNVVLSVAVLEDGTRIINQSDIFRAFGRPKRGSRDVGDQKDAKLPGLIDANNLKPFISNDLMGVIKPFEYQNLSGRIVTGYDAVILPLICEVYIDAKTATKPDGKPVLTSKQMPNYEAAKLLMKGLYRVSIIALVDEVTGYQYQREAAELQAILQTFISQEIQDWQRTFELSFYKEIFRLWGVPFTAANIRRKPLFIGKLTNELVYKNMPKGYFVLETLKSKTPKTESGYYKYKLHQSLTKEAGRTALVKVINTVEALASISDSKSKFLKLMKDKYNPDMQLSLFPEIDKLASTENNKPPTKASDFDNQLKGLLRVPPPREDK